MADGVAVVADGEGEGDAPRRRRRRGGRGRGRGRGHEGGADGAPDESVEVHPAVAAGPTEAEMEFEVDDESIPAPRPVRPAAFGSVWDSQIGVAAPAAGRPAPADEEFDDEPEIPEYLLAERRNRGGVGSRGGQPMAANRGGRGRPGSYAAAIDRERYGRGGAPSAAGGTPRYGEPSGRGGPNRDAAPRRDVAPRRDATPRRDVGRPMPVRPDRLEGHSGDSEPWSEVPPELEELLKAQLAAKLGRQAESRPAMPGATPGATPAEPAPPTSDAASAPARGRGRRRHGGRRDARCRRGDRAARHGSGARVGRPPRLAGVARPSLPPRRQRRTTRPRPSMVPGSDAVAAPKRRPGRPKAAPKADASTRRGCPGHRGGHRGRSEAPGHAHEGRRGRSDGARPAGGRSSGTEAASAAQGSRSSRGRLSLGPLVTGRRRAASSSGAFASDDSSRPSRRVSGPDGGPAPVDHATRFATRGQPAALAAVEHMLDSGVPQVLLLIGPAAIGKTTLALDLAAGLLCVAADGVPRPCRSCRACRLVAAGTHQDLHRLAPEGSGRQVRIGDPSDPEPGTVRHLIHEMARLPVEGRHRVAIIEGAHRLNEDAQNALLKTLEEPPAGATLVLCADEPERLLPTLRSRAATLRLGPLGIRSIEGLLGERGVDPPRAARLARLAGGRPGRALAYAASPVAVAAREEISRSLLDLLSESRSRRLAVIRELLARSGDLAGIGAEAGIGAIRSRRREPHRGAVVGGGSGHSEGRPGVTGRASARRHGAARDVDRRGARPRSRGGWRARTGDRPCPDRRPRVGSGADPAGRGAGLPGAAGTDGAAARGERQPRAGHGRPRPRLAPRRVSGPDELARSPQGRATAADEAAADEAAAERLEATVIGSVQGVGFRWFALESARGLALRGWVANRADGAVICVAEGPRPALEALLMALARGPISAQVERVIPVWMPATGRFSRFEIRSGSHPGD